MKDMSRWLPEGLANDQRGNRPRSGQ